MGACLNLSFLLALLQYASGQLSTFQCFGGFFTDELCGTTSVVQVTSAVYGISAMSAGPCDPDVNDCTADVNTKNAVYFNIIEERCNGKRACQGLQADRADLRAECGDYSNYVRIFYTCTTDGVTNEPKPTTAMSTDGTTPSDGNNSTWPGDSLPPGTFNPAGMLAGLGVSLILIATLAFVSLCIKRKRNKADSEETEAEQTVTKQAAVVGNNPGFTHDNDDDESWDDEEWDEVSDDDIADGEQPPGSGPARCTTRKRTRRTTKKRLNGQAVVDEFAMNDPLYDVIDPDLIKGSNEEIEEPQSTPCGHRISNGTSQQYPTSESGYRESYSAEQPFPLQSGHRESLGIEQSYAPQSNYRESHNTEQPYPSQSDYRESYGSEQQELTNPKTSILLDRRKLLSLPLKPRTTSDSKIMINNEIYDSQSFTDAVSEVIGHDDVYLEPVQTPGASNGGEAIYANSPDVRRKKHQDENESSPPSAYYGLQKPAEDNKLSYEALDHAVDDDVSKDRTGTNASRMYWSLEPPQDSNA